MKSHRSVNCYVNVKCNSSGTYGARDGALAYAERGSDFLHAQLLALQLACSAWVCFSAPYRAPGVDSSSFCCVDSREWLADPQTHEDIGPAPGAQATPSY